MNPDGRSGLSRDDGPFIYTGLSGPIHGPAFRWERRYSLDSDDKWDAIDVPVEVLTIYACELHFGEFSKFRDDNFWRSAYEWGGTGTDLYVRHFDSSWCWIRSDGAMLGSAPKEHWKSSTEEAAIHHGLRLLLDQARDSEPIDPIGGLTNSNPRPIVGG